MLKKNKWTLILTSIIIMLPTLVGLIFWEKFPKPVIFLPVIILVLQWVCVLFTVKDPRNAEQNQKVLSLVLWICPLISTFANAITYIAYFRIKINPMILVALLLGLTFIIIGNYLPKCKQNFTIGIKVRWTLANEENWNATHRLSGKLWVIGGFLILCCIFLPQLVAIWAFFGILFVMCIIPTLYSYVYYKKQVAQGKAPKKATLVLNKSSKRFSTIGCVVAGILLIGALVLMFTGDINVSYNRNSFTIEATYWSDKEIPYMDIDHLEYQESFEAGSRLYGFASPRLFLGSFANDELGEYTLYAYTPSKSAIVLEINGDIVVFSGKTTEETEKIYKTLLPYVR